MTRRWLNSNWLELTISALVACAEAAMIAPWLRALGMAFGGPDAWVPSPVGMAIVGLISYWAARTMLEGRWDVGAARGVSMGIWLGMMVVWYGFATGRTLSAPLAFIDNLAGLDGTLFGLLILGGLAWWRGTALGAEPDPFTPEFARRVVASGVLVLGLALLVSVMVREDTAVRMTESAAVALPILLVTGLSAAAGIQVRTARAEVRGGGEANRTGAGWLGGAAGIAFGILLIAGLIAGVAGREIWMQALAPVIALLNLIQTVLSWILLAFAYVMFALLLPFIWLVQRFLRSDGERPEQELENGPIALEDLIEASEQALSPLLVQVVQISLIVLIAAVLIWLVLQSLRRRETSATDEPVDEIRESVWSRDLAMDQLRGLFRGLGRQRGGRHRSGFDLNATPESVRDAYRHLLALAEQTGQERRPNESPDDYAARLHRDLLGQDEPLDDLTLRYLDARYGDHSTEDDLHAARRDWEAIRARLRSQQAEGRG